MDYAVAKLHLVEDRINRSTFGRVFRLEGCGHQKTIRGATFLREIRAGMTTFATMAYIIAVNSAVLSESGGTCECASGKPNGCRGDAVYDMCISNLKHDLITATAALAGMSSIVFGFLTNLPVALGPGMGLNAYFTYQVVGWHGTGAVPYRIALTAVFVEGFIFMFLALTGMRQWLVRMIPATIKTACGVGIGLFLTEIGLSYSAGIGAITGGYSTPLAIGGCPANDLDEQTGECLRNIMQNPAMWIGIFLGGIFVAFLMAFKVKSAIIIGIALVSIISWPRNTSFTYFPYTDAGNDRFDFFKQVVAFHPIEQVLAVQQWDLGGTSGAQFALALVTFLYVDIIDCTATLYSMAKFCGVVEENGDFPRSTIAYCTDAACISIGSLFGCSPVTAFIESGAGVAEGGRTGLTAISTGCCFLISLFFAPILASVPPWATGATLVLVGCLMIRQVTNINWQYIGDAVPSFVTLAFMPFSYSVAYGLIAGMMVYVVLNTMIWTVVQLTNGRVTPSNWAEKEVYRFGMGRTDIPSWMTYVHRKVSGSTDTEVARKEALELVDCDSTINHGSRSGSAEGKEAMPSRSHHRRMEYDLPSLD
ncbi:xanthine/uracil permease family protein-like protein [Xylariaceae sp. FL0016]|nr:xanthine/uracil permease family protein-like protein [Xylariaceae sp. FL0016]